MFDKGTYLFEWILSKISNKNIAMNKKERSSDTPRYFKQIQPKDILKKTKIIDGIYYPIIDEDLDDTSTWVGRLVLKLLFLLPVHDVFDKFRTEEDAERYISEKLGKNWDISTHRGWDKDYTSDKTLHDLAFNGLLSHRLQKEQNHYIVDFSYMNKYSLRNSKFMKYGGKAIFTRDVIKSIEYQNIIYTPKSSEWENIKAIFRSSSAVAFTAEEHLIYTHLVVSNTLVTCGRERLSWNHPIRRLLKPFTYRSVIVNKKAISLLFLKNNILNRSTAFTNKSQKEYYIDTFSKIDYGTLKDHMKKNKITESDKIPYYEDGMLAWKVLEDYIRDYMGIYYKTDEEWEEDLDAQDWWTSITSNIPEYNIPVWATKGKLIETVVEYLTHAIFTVTYFHEYIGSIEEYVMRGNFFSFRIMKGETYGDIQTTNMIGVLMLGVGKGFPPLRTPYQHILLDDKARELTTKFLDTDLVEQGKIIDARNEERKINILSFHPENVAQSTST